MIIGVNETLFLEMNGIEYEVKPGQILLIPANVLHSGYATCKPGVSFYYFHFHCNNEVKFINEVSMNSEVVKFRSHSDVKRSDVKRKDSNIYIPIYSIPKYIERINILFNQLIHIDKSSFFSHYGVDYLATFILIELSEQVLADYNTTSELVDIKLAKILEWIRINVSSSNISVQSIAEKFNYNKDYLSRIFKKETGITMTEYINLQKINKAKDLLTRTDKNIKRIAYDVGIQDEKYFMRLFKKYMGLTPTDFRKAYYLKNFNSQ
ncbi:AraC family transcriptional regulator [Lederbergia galactosidilytica]|nr:AraC family transcriptional regulator [Lederbergia galactosidilytica]